MVFYVTSIESTLKNKKSVNFSWSIVFFRFQKFGAAIGVIGLLILLVIAMIVVFRKIRPAAAGWNIPYLLWLLFAAYLNIGTFLLNP